MKKYESMLTTVGKAKLMAAQAKGEHVQLTTFAVGSGIQATVETQKALQKEEWRGAITNIAVDSKDKNVLDVETVIPANEGGFHIREFGVFDEVGDLIIVGNTPESYKPLLDAGAASSMRIISKTIISNAANVTLLMDDNALYVTHEHLEQAVAQQVVAMDLSENQAIRDVKQQVTEVATSLNQVENFGVATEAEAEAGTSNAKYMTPLRTKQAIEKKISSSVDSKSEVTMASSKAIKIVMDKANEAFMSASNGKKLVGEAIAGVDKAVVIPTKPSFQDLATAIMQISTGKKWASGTADVIVRDANDYLGRPKYGVPAIEVLGLDFRPSLIVVEYGMYTLPAYYNIDQKYGDYEVVTAGEQLVYRAQEMDFYVNEEGFCISSNTAYTSGSRQWYAYE